MKANKIVIWFWGNVVKNKDAKRVAAQPVPENVDEYLDIEYISDNHPLHKLDVFRPSNNNEKLPVIFDIHGGGWYYGDKELNQYYCKALTHEGFASVSISYRLSPEVDFKTQVQDVVKAMNYMNEIKDKYNLDMDKFFIAGDSAGGHIVGILLNIMKSKELQKAYDVDIKVDVKGACMICPACEPLEMAGAKFAKSSIMKLYFNPVFGKGYLKNGMNKLTSFRSTLQEGIVPVYFVSAYKDMLKGETKEGYNLLKSKGVKTELCFYDEPKVEGHVLDHVFNVLHWEWEEAKEANKGMCDFFKEIVKD